MLEGRVRTVAEGVAIAVSAATGVWLLAAAELLGLTGPARLSYLVVGPLAATFAVISASAATRAMLRLNVALGLWLIAGPRVAEGWASGPENALAGVILVVMALVPRSQRGRFGGGWSTLFRSSDRSAFPADSSRGPAR